MSLAKQFSENHVVYQQPARTHVLGLSFEAKSCFILEEVT